jgi:hypothetical protein
MFSDDLFSIEASGPEHRQHLSVVDVPGLFHSKSPVTLTILIKG